MSDILGALEPWGLLRGCGPLGVPGSPASLAGDSMMMTSVTQ